MARASRIVGIALGAALLGPLTGCGGLGAWAQRQITPTAPFSAQAPPRAPDYADPAAWSALPEREDAGDAVPDGVTPVDQRAAPADVFYVHPTSYVANHWNGPFDDPKLNADTDRVATGIQAPAFNGCCAVYAPRYRQANGTAFTDPSADGQAALDLAYGDVSRAFDTFLARTGDRPFVLAGHSQGAILGERLLYERIAGSALQERLVYAVLPGAGVTVAGLAERGISSCDTPASTGCVVAWNARGPAFVPGGPFEYDRPDDRPLLCTNPLTWRADAPSASAAQNPGAVFLEVEDRAPRPSFVDASCTNPEGYLTVTTLGDAPRDLPSRVLDRVMGPENYHPIEYQLYFLSLREDAVRRVAAWEDARRAAERPIAP